MIQFFEFELSYWQIFIFYFVSLLIGMSKTGVHGSGMMAVPLLAAAFGGRQSSGILLPIICLADIFGVWYYHRHASWDYLKRLFPAAAVGIVAGSVVGDRIDDNIFRVIMAVAIGVSVLLMVWIERSDKKEIPNNTWVARLTGVTAGFTSMVGNLAGSVMVVYFLSMKLPKNAFIGTTAWFFLVINFFKLPFHIFHWDTIDINVFLMDLSTLPVIICGGLIGIAIVRNLSEQIFRWFLIAMTLVASVFMLL